MGFSDITQQRVKKIFARNLDYYMTAKGKTRADISVGLNIPYPTVCSWLDERAYPRMDKLEKLAMFLGITKSDLIEEHPDRAIGNNDAANTIKQAMKDKPELKLLFEASMKATDTQIKKTIQILEVLMRENE